MRLSYLFPLACIGLVTLGEPLRVHADPTSEARLGKARSEKAVKKKAKVTLRQQRRAERRELMRRGLSRGALRLIDSAGAGPYVPAIGPLTYFSAVSLPVLSERGTVAYKKCEPQLNPDGTVNRNVEQQCQIIRDDAGNKLVTPSANGLRPIGFNSYNILGLTGPEGSSGRRHCLLNQEVRTSAPLNGVFSNGGGAVPFTTLLGGALQNDLSCSFQGTFQTDPYQFLPNVSGGVVVDESSVVPLLPPGAEALGVPGARYRITPYPNRYHQEALNQWGIARNGDALIVAALEGGGVSEVNDSALYRRRNGVLEFILQEGTPRTLADGRVVQLRNLGRVPAEHTDPGISPSGRATFFARVDTPAGGINSVFSVEPDGSVADLLAPYDPVRCYENPPVDLIAGAQGYQQKAIDELGTIYVRAGYCNRNQPVLARFSPGSTEMEVLVRGGDEVPGTGGTIRLSTAREGAHLSQPFGAPRVNHGHLAFYSLLSGAVVGGSGYDASDVGIFRKIHGEPIEMVLRYGMPVSAQEPARVVKPQNIWALHSRLEEETLLLNRHGDLVFRGWIMEPGQTIPKMAVIAAPRGGTPFVVAAEGRTYSFTNGETRVLRSLRGPRDLYQGQMSEGDSGRIDVLPLTSNLTDRREVAITAHHELAGGQQAFTLTESLIAASAIGSIADSNYNGAVSVGDLLLFLQRYFGREFSADMNGDGLISVSDIFEYLGAFFRG